MKSVPLLIFHRIFTVFDWFERLKIKVMKARKKIRVEDLISNFPKIKEEIKIETNFKLVTGSDGKCLLIGIETIK